MDGTNLLSCLETGAFMNGVELRTVIVTCYASVIEVDSTAVVVCDKGHVNE